MAWTYADLDRRARSLGALLRDRGATGERILLLFRPGLDFVAAFFGCLYAGAVAVPAAPPRKRGAERLDVIVADACPLFVLTSGGALPPEEERRGMHWIVADEVPLELADEWRPPQIHCGSLAFLQYTSGSTSAPKGVEVSHGNLAHNESVLEKALRHNESSVLVSWLPLYHDMGLIGVVLQSVWVGGSCVLMPPPAFLQRPLRWLAAISRYRGTTSGAPNFAYDLCARRISEEERAGLDLSSWEVAFNGSEPVRAETLDRFTDAFRSCGFRRRTFFPCYGLAEATLMVTGSSAEGRTARVAEGPTLVSCGRVGDGLRVEIVDPESGRRAAPGEVGEVWVAGPSVARGYWQRPEQTEETFQASVADMGEVPFLRTGDLGLVEDGHLFVAGRLKDLIIIRGRNHYPQDIELTAERSHPALRGHAAAAFPVDAGGEERLALVIEPERTFRDDLTTVAAAVRLAVAREHELEIFDLALVAVGGVPRTTSGKVRRRACRERLLAGELTERWRERGAATPVPSRSPVPSREELVALGAGERRARLEDWLRRAVAALLRTEPAALAAGAGRLGLDSLAAVGLQAQVEAALRISIPLETLAESADVGELAGEIATLLEEGLETEEVAMEAAGPVEVYPASQGQRALWFLHRLDPRSPAYNLVVALRLPDDASAEHLRSVMAALAVRHQALCSAFEERDDLVVRTRADTAVPVAEVDASGLEGVELARCLRAEGRRPFDLAAGPLVRAAFVTGAPGGGPILVLTVHHAVADFASLAILVRDFCGLWSGRLAAEAGTFQYSDFVDWQRRWLASAAGERAWHHWRWSLGNVPQLDLPTDRPRPPAQTDRGRAVRHYLPRQAMDGLRALAEATASTTATVALAALQALLARLSAQTAFPVGFVASGRRPELDQVVGYFVNPLALSMRLTPDAGAAALLPEVRRTILSSLEHQAFPFVRLAERLQPDRDPSRSPVFQVLLNVVQPSPGAEALAAFAVEEPGARAGWDGLVLENVPVETRIAQLDLALTVAEVDGELGMALRFNEDLFDPTTAGRWLDGFARILEGMVREPERPVGRLELFSPPQRHQVMVEWAHGPALAPPEGGLFELLATRAEKHPDAVAVIHGDRSVTYRELADRAQDLGARLRALEVGPEMPMGVCLSRTPDMIAALFGILAAGGAYVPLDPAYPARRNQFVLADSGAPVLVTESRHAELFAELPVRRLLVDAPTAGSLPANGFKPVPADPDRLAYVVYTSGSTGRPKGVAIRHGGIVARCRWTAEAFDAAETAAVLASTSICFDVAAWEIFATASRGGTMVLVDDTLALAESPWCDRVTLINTVPSALAALLDVGAVPASARQVNLAGEALPRKLVEPTLTEHPGRRLLNIYGPSEDTIYSTARAIELGEAGAPGIGRPLPGTRVFVLGVDFAPAPFGVPGELFIGGVGVARGYFGRPGLTAERFLPDPFSGVPAARLYRTGDRVRHRADGDLEFLGRLDFQVKIRGVRVELGEVEAALGSHPSVAESVAVVQPDATEGHRLTAYVALRPAVSPDVTAGTSAATPEELRAHVAGRLPAPMVPADLIVLPALPRTPNGKVDRAALPVPERSASACHEAPVKPLEGVLASMWAQLLDIAEVGRDDSFFALGGHSLLGLRLVAKVRERLGVALPLVAVLRSPTVAGLAREIEALRGTAREGSPLVSGARPERLPLTFAQERLWFLDRLEPGSATYAVPLAVRLTGPLSVPALAAAAGALAERHEVLRATFPEVEGHPTLRISEKPCRTALIDLAGLTPARRQAELDRALAAEAARPFDLETGPIFRSLLLRLDSSEHVWLAAFHHIVVDGWSIDVILSEIAELYGAATEERPAALAPLPLQYPDYAVWQRRPATRDVEDGGLIFWRQRLAGVPVLQLPPDRPPPSVPSRHGGRCGVAFSAAVTGRLRAAAAARGTSLFILLLACFRWLLWRLAGQADLGIGSPVACRERAELQGLVGLFANMVVLRTRLPEKGTFRELLQHEQELAMEAWAFEDVPFERIVEVLAPQRDLDHHPLFQTSFTLQPVELAALPGLAMVVEDVHTDTSKFDLSLLLWEFADGRLGGNLEYRGDLLDAVTARRWAACFERLAAAVTSDDAARLAAVPLFAAAEHHQILHEWGEGPAPASAPVAAVHEMVVEVARRWPDTLAVAAPDGTLTYAELVAGADRVARRLRALGVRSESVVAVGLERSRDLIVALLGVLRAGAAYLPLDLSWPEQRLTSLLGEARPRAVVARGATPWLESSIARVDPAAAGAVAANADRTTTVDPSGLAYVIYTSGSTGRPKGIGIPHANLLDLIRWHQRAYAVSASSRATQIASPAFDASVWEIWPYLACGASLVLLDETSRWSPRHLIDRLAEERITHAFVPTPLLELALAEPWPADMALCYLLTGGDRLHGRPGTDLSAVLVNHYGPTECTVVTTCSRVAPGTSAAPPPIGRPIDGIYVRILDRRGAPAPIGVPGELYVGGQGLARGYIGRPGRTAESFLPDPFARSGGRIYRTGDLVRWRTDGEIDFLGRLDHQVKVRGFRIELGEVEAALLAHPGAREAVVVTWSSVQGPSLAAYAVPAAEESSAAVTAAELREHLRRSLPDYMVPPSVTMLEALPLTSNGKIDRSALPKPEVVAEAFVAPRNEIEEELTRIWGEVLDMDPERISAEADFFALGGHSLQVTRLVSRLRTAFRLELPVRTLFEAPTVAALSVRLVEELAAQAGDEAMAALFDEMERSGAALREGVGDAR